MKTWQWSEERFKNALNKNSRSTKSYIAFLKKEETGMIYLLDAYDFAPQFIKLDPKFVNFIAKSVVRFFNSGASSTTKVRTLMRYPDTIKGFLSDRQTDQLIGFLLESKDCMSSHERKYVALFCAENTKNEDLLSRSLEKFSRNLDMRSVYQFASALPHGLMHKSFEKILKGKLEVLGYTKDDLKNKSKKKKFLTIISKTPSALSKVSFGFKVTKEDLVALAPVARFKLLKSLFEEDFYVEMVRERSLNSRWAQYVPDLKKLKEMNFKDNISVENISVKDMKQLLFPISMKKHNDFSNFISDYEKLKNSE